METTVKKTAATVLMETAILPQESVSVTLASMGHSKSRTYLGHLDILGLFSQTDESQKSTKSHSKWFKDE